MWLVIYSKDVNEYLTTAGWIGINLHRSIVRLYFTNNGLPDEGELIDYGNGLYWWIVAGHSLLLLRSGTETRILELYTGELRSKEEIEEKLTQYRSE